MHPLLARIDDRLVHGQVVVGCCEPLRARRVLLVDDVVAHDALQRQLFALATPPEVELEVVDRAAALVRLRELENDAGLASTILVVAHSVVMRDLVRGGAPVREVNLGGAHRRPDAQELWPGFHLTPEDRDALRELVALGVRVRVQTVPGATSVDAAPALGIGPA